MRNNSSTDSIEIRIGTLEDSIEDTMNSLDEKDQDDDPRIVYISPKDAHKLLSFERLQLIREIRTGEKNINELADALHRKRESVSRDLAILARHSMIKMRRVGRENLPQVPDHIQITV